MVGGRSAQLGYTNTVPFTLDVVKKIQQ